MNDSFQPGFQPGFQALALPVTEALYGWRRGAVIRRMAHTLEEDIAASVLELAADERRRRKRLSDEWLLGLIDDDTFLEAA